MGQFGCPTVKYLDQELSSIMEPKADEFYAKDNAKIEHVYIYISTIWWMKTSRDLKYKKPSLLSAREKPNFR